MEHTINVGIDLGTTNSVIAKFNKGEVTVYKNPVSWKDTTPSVVSFRKDKILVGQKAKEYLEKSPQNVVSNFKRKMGTNETFKIKALNKSVTPVELSAHVLKELKTFVQTDEPMDAAVITIPASFDTVQAHATDETGHLAGFKQVILLQEPIAASLAYANKIKNLKDGQWIVYDLGGGTFDVALVKITEGEMRILDHEGDNFLGGTDFDRLIVEKSIIPFLEKNYAFENLKSEMESASGRYNNKYYAALHRAETAKIELSARTSAEIDGFFMNDDNDEECEVVVEITRSEFEAYIKEYVDKTIDMIRKIMTRNSLTSNDIQFVLMVGGSTYIPYVRNRVKEMLQIPLSCDELDPTTAIAVGAAYFAGTKNRDIEKPTTPQKAQPK
ncbi:Hsp70 family protein [candidate division KSB1 bacterium]|nr:Hsp70 family protein [candidate division KSB1 bacterium]